MSAKLIWVTPEAEKVIMYCARVSSNNQESTDPRLLSYCIKQGHWSVFEQASMCVEIQTSRAISAQILRHKSFQFQEFSQRYQEVTQFETYKARRQDKKNRQNSIDDLDQATLDWFEDAQSMVQMLSEDLYRQALDKGIAKEQARFLLPMAASTKLYMTGSIRSWIHYLQLRTANGTQQEHIDIAKEIQSIFIKELPIISQALGWDGEV